MNRILTILCLGCFLVAAGCSSAREAYNDTEDAVQEAAGDVAEGTADVYDGVEDAVQHAGNEVGDEVSDAYDGAEDAVQHTGNDAGEAVADTYDSVEDEIQNEEDMPSAWESDIEWAEDDDAMGTISFSRMDDHIMLNSEFSGLRNGNYVVRVHEGTSCMSPGGAYVPVGENGYFLTPAEQDDVSSWGRFSVAGGSAAFEGSDYGLSMYGRDDLEGHAVVVYDRMGNRVGCGLID